MPVILVRRVYIAVTFFFFIHSYICTLILNFSCSKHSVHFFSLFCSKHVSHINQEFSVIFLFLRPVRPNKLLLDINSQSHHAAVKSSVHIPVELVTNIGAVH